MLLFVNSVTKDSCIISRRDIKKPTYIKDYLKTKSRQILTRKSFNFMKKKIAPAINDIYNETQLLFIIDLMKNKFMCSICSTACQR